MNQIEVLVISNIMDFTTDYVCLELNNRGISYLRINRDQFNEYKITFNINELQLHIKLDNEEYLINKHCLKSVYYRAPVFLRDSYKPKLDFNCQLYRSQWMAFLRNLTIFQNARWLNSPNDTFKAENKMLQLNCANESGFLCPKTFLANTVDGICLNDNEQYILKSLDTVLLSNGDKEAFVYSMAITGKELKCSNFSSAPVIIQEYLNPKIDIRVSVIGNNVFPVKITKNSIGITGDWRKEKDNVDFIPIEMPMEINKKCIKLLKMLNLGFGGIDLIFTHGNYYFIEVNPTGEWAWLVQQAKLPIDKAICDYLLQ